MRADTKDFRRAIQWDAARNGKAALKGLILGYVAGIRGPRQSAVSLRDIEKWFHATPKAFIGECLNELILEGTVAIMRNGPRTAQSHRQGYSYEVAQ